MVKQSRISPSEAEGVAIQCLQFLASDPDLLGGFLAVTGLGPGNLRAAARDRQFLGAILTYVNDDERILLDCAAAMNIRPESIAMAYEVLVGVIHPDDP
ncbi:MAG: DUF3572 domain-containing protein [Beijerinckiaceae bacterium]|nr:DUF3572 domain-containing protein [Beijerinckiaceae bacterium]